MKSGPCFITARIALDKMGVIKNVLPLCPARAWACPRAVAVKGALCHRAGGLYFNVGVPMCPSTPCQWPGRCPLRAGGPQTLLPHSC